MIKQAGVIAWLIGIAALAGLVVWSGLDAVGHAVASVGWGILLVVLARIVTVSVAGAGWWLLFPLELRPPLWLCVLVRFLREAANVLLPLGQIGGDLLGAALLTLRSVRAALATASVIVDILVQAATQLLFAVIGLLVLLALGVDPLLAGTAAIGLAIGAFALVGFYLAQGDGGQRFLRWAMGCLTGDLKGRVLGTIDAVYQDLAMIYASRRRMIVSSVVHMAGWLVGVAEVWIVFWFMGHPVSLAEALVIESLLHAIRGAAFFIPGALGAQEGGLVLMCAIFGIPAEQAIALSLVKRAADLVLGAPALLAWQMLEWRRLMPGVLLGPQQAREAVTSRVREP
jgi:putative membrane protein